MLVKLLEVDMSVRELRQAFNEIAAPKFTAEVALLSYVHAHDAESQILTFRGRDGAGNAFEKKTDPLRPKTDLLAATRALATDMIKT